MAAVPRCECFCDGIMQRGLGGAAASEGVMSVFVERGPARTFFCLVADGESQFALDQQREGFVV